MTNEQKIAIGVGVVAVVYLLTKPARASTLTYFPNGVLVPPPPANAAELAANPEVRSGRGHF